MPVDSEHSAIYQALRAGAPHEVRRILLTASGGPFRGKSRAELERVTVADALQHPTWTMGAKITIDSSTLMNKGLEVIEAHELFGVDFDHVDVVVHPQSIVHGMVEFTRRRHRRSVVACPTCGCRSDWRSAPPTGSTSPSAPSTGPRLGALTFETPDLEAFPCLGLAYAAGRAGGGAPATLSAANEVAVEAFLGGRIPWLGIASVVEDVMQRGTGNVEDVADVLEADRVARERARAAVERRSRSVKDPLEEAGSTSPAAAPASRSCWSCSA